ncbi:hypothetical protein [Streptomyces sp. IMTB 2501]|uniref:hypothetical protein n=1 Tax=Streptomyces sp. IMTB 2501 TaxID=1776340 RepID=UPI0015B7CD0A|nr:hypothetical protein [Streptomyces sp. IMTB 2501]
MTRVQGDEDLSPPARLCPNLRIVRLYAKQAVSLEEARYAAQFPNTDVRIPPVRPYAF